MSEIQCKTTQCEQKQVINCIFLSQIWKTVQKNIPLSRNRLACRQRIGGGEKQKNDISSLKMANSLGHVNFSIML